MESANLAKLNDFKNIFKITSLYNIGLEESMIKSLICDNKKFESVSEILTKDHFYSEAHGIIYKSIASIIKDNKIADYASVAQMILKEKISNPNDIIDMLDHILESDKIILGPESVIQNSMGIDMLYRRRKILEMSQELSSKVRDGNTSIASIISNFEKKITSVMTSEVEKKVEKLSEITSNVILNSKKKDIQSHIQTGFCDMDRLIGGFMPSDLIIIAARPSMGKTAIAVNIAKHIATKRQDTKRHNVLFFSLEMSSQQIGTRVLSSIASVDSDKIRFGKVSQKDVEEFIEAQKKISGIGLFVDDTPRISTDEILFKARRFKRKEGLSAIFIDYLQLITHTSGSRYENRVQEISEITMFLKGLAKELNIPVIALSQLSRAVESREDKRPLLSDLRESGSIEQDADMVMFIYREEYYLERQTKEYVDMQKQNEATAKLEKVKNKADVIVAKNRNGQIGAVKLHYKPEYTLFSNLVN